MSQTTTVAVNKVVKKRAQKKAKQYNLSLSSLVTILLNDFSLGKIVIGTQQQIDENGFTPEQRKEILEAWKSDDNDEFNSMDEMIIDLKKQACI